MDKNTITLQEKGNDVIAVPCACVTHGTHSATMSNIFCKYFNMVKRIG